MTDMDARVKFVVDVLAGAGKYCQRPKPLHIADVDYEFEFDAVLEGPGEEHNLIFVCSLTGSQFVAIERRIRAVSTALRRTGSTRPFSLVLILTQPHYVAVASLELLCRVIPVLPDADVPLLLSPLMPLPLPAQSQTIVAAVDALKKELASHSIDSHLAADLIGAANGDGPSVEKAVLAAIRKAAVVPSAPPEEK